MGAWVHIGHSPEPKYLLQAYGYNKMLLAVLKEGLEQIVAGQIQHVWMRWTPHPVTVTIKDNKDCTKVLSYSYYTTYRVGGPPNLCT